MEKSDWLIILTYVLFLSSLLLTTLAVQDRGIHAEGNPLIKWVFINPYVGYPVLFTLWFFQFYVYFYLRVKNDDKMSMMIKCLLAIYGIAFLNDLIRFVVFV